VSDPHDPTPDELDDDPVLAAAGERLRAGSTPVDAGAVEAAVWRRRSRQARVVAVAALVAVAVLGGVLFVQRSDHGDTTADLAHDRRAPSGETVDALLASLPSRPIDPTDVQLVSTVSTFADCDALIGDLRRVGAEHVGSQGFGASYGIYGPTAGYAEDRLTTADAGSKTLTPYGPSPGAGGDEGTTLGTNVQVEGVDELDLVKAEGHLIYDLDGKGNLRITDARDLKVLSTLDVTPPGPQPSGDVPRPDTQVDQLLVSQGRVVIFGTETEISDPVAGDPSATRASTGYMTVAFVDATDPAAPKVTDRVRIEGSLVAARLVGGEVRMVTTSNMADLGFVVPTTPTSVAKALEQNRRSVAGSTSADWIPDWQRGGEQPQPLVPCQRVHVPDTFSGVAMTSMVTFPLGTGRFAPAGTSILAPATTLYAGLDRVAVSSEVWVDPIDRERLKFDDWQTAIHEFRFAEGDDAPTYEGSGIVDGSTIGQFAFGEVGDSLGVVTTKGTPWSQDPKAAVDLTLLTPDGKGKLAVASKVADLSNGKGEVTAVRFVEGRVLISTGFFGRQVYVIDVTDPTKPRRAGNVAVAGSVGYFHPLAGHQALVIGSRTDEVGTGKDRQTRQWVQAQLLDVSNADAPRIVSTWEVPWRADQVGADHHAFTFWPDRKLAMWGLNDTQPSRGGRPNEAAVVKVDGTVAEVARPQASKPNEVPPPCPAVDVTDPEIRQMLGEDALLLHCDDGGRKELDWPRYQCYRVDDGTVRQYAPDLAGKGSFFVCTLAPHPTVARVLVVAGRPILFTDQTLEALDPTTFASTAIAYHPTSAGYVAF
jgi:hypothetical protein